MKTITMVEFRNNAEKIIHWARLGKRMIMTYRGKPVMRLEPIMDEDLKEDDPFYHLHELAAGKGGNLSNRQMDKIIYE